MAENLAGIRPAAAPASAAEAEAGFMAVVEAARTAVVTTSPGT
jgi:hypothetical protein